MVGIAKSGDHAVKGYGGQSGDSNSAIVTWHPYGRQARAAELHNQRGGRHIVIENGYIRKDRQGQRYYCWEFDGFNGQGWVPKREIDGSRWDAMRLDLAPWRRAGDHILVCGQRGGDYSDYSMPMDWPESILERLGRLTDRPIVYRPHPGRTWLPDNIPPGVSVSERGRPLETDLEGAHACVVWCSNAATEALIAGVPVFYQGPTLKLGAIATDDLSLIEDPPMPDRERAFWQLAWSQWSADEIASGKAWRFMMYSAEGRA